MNKTVFPGIMLIWILYGNITGCASIGREFPSAAVSMIRLGQTTQSQIRSMFGEPWRVGVENGQRTWTYGHYQYSLFGEGSTEDLVVRFDSSGVVASYVFNTTKHQEKEPVTER